MPQELLIAACLVLVFEGILPFVAPQAWRRMVASMLLLQDRQLRILGFAIMLLGVVLLQVFN